MLSVIILSVVLMSFIMLSEIMLRVTMLNVIILSVIVLSVVAPFLYLRFSFCQESSNQLCCVTDFLMASVTRGEEVLLKGKAQYC